MSQTALDSSYDVPEATRSRQLMLVTVGTIVALLAILGVLVYLSTYATPAYNANSPAAQLAAAKRLQRVGSVDVKLADTSAGGPPKTGEEVYQSVCAACHGTGAAGAPKFGDSSEWGPRIAQGVDVLFKHALGGFTGSKGTMPPKGGSTLSDYEIERAVVYMANKGGASFAEPKPAAGAASGAAPAASGAVAAASGAPAAASASAAAAPASGAAVAAAAPVAAASAGASVAAPAKAGSAVAAADGAGKALYDSTCQACHGTGVAGAPKFGDKGEWAPRIAQGEATLFKHAIEGFTGTKGSMPPKGGSTASDADVQAAVRYMVAAAK